MGGTAAAYADPEFEVGLRTLLAQDQASRSERIRRGRDWARHFAWERCADETLAVYREAADAGGR